MSTAWEYLRTTAAPSDLVSLGREGWELVAIEGAEWIFKRPEPDPAERFTLDQRAVALHDVDAHRAVARHLLNPEIAALVRRVNHTQMLILADRGFPIPNVKHVVDISLTSDVPTIPQVLTAILPDLPLDRIILASEMEVASPGRWHSHHQGDHRLQAVPHLEFKRLAQHAVGCIRTGDSSPYANLILVGG